MSIIKNTDDKTIDAFAISTPAVVLNVYIGFGLEPTYIGGKTVVKIRKNEHLFSVEAEDDDCKKKLIVNLSGLTVLVEDYKKTGRVVTTSVLLERSSGSKMWMTSQKFDPPLHAGEASEGRAVARRRVSGIYTAIQEFVRPYVA